MRTAPPALRPARPERRPAAAAAAIASVVSAFVGLAVLVYLASRSPERFVDLAPDAGWIVGPRAERLVDAAVTRVERGLAALGDRSTPAADRLAAYRSELEAARRLLERSLRAQPLEAGALLKLAAVRWEIAAASDSAEAQSIGELLALASSMAPRMPSVQQRIGELLLKVGRRDEALRYLSRAIELDRDRGEPIVALLRSVFFSIEEIRAGLPDHPAVLIALRDAYSAESRAKQFVDAIEKRLGDEPTVELLFAYGRACLEAGDARRLRAGVDRLDAFASPVLEANRLRQRSRANAALGQHLAAVADAERAQRLAPDDPSLTELLGDQLAAAGDAGRAIETLRAALAQLARGGGNPLARARIYRKIGQAEESRGQPANAYDAYRIAVELAREPIAASRLARMREDAGMP